MWTILQRLRRVALAHDGELSDALLLARFVERRDAAAFEVLVRRHGPMVMGTCRRVLRCPHDAEDAFQATFLVLARKADAVSPRVMLPNWLHGVAHQTALKAKAVADRRRGRERQVAELPEPEAPRQDQSASEWQPLLDQELSRLPSKYRLAVLLCDVQGKSRKEAAEQLGWREGTLSGRLSRARGLFSAQRLARRGLANSGALLAALSQKAGSLSAPLVRSTAEAAGQFAAGQTAGFSAEVVALTQEVLKAMTMSKFRIGTVVLLSVVALAGAGMGLTLSAPSITNPGQRIARKQNEKENGEQKADNKAKDASKAAESADDAEPKATATKVKKLQTQRRDLLKKIVDALWEEYSAGRGLLASMIQAGKDLLVAELELATKPEQRLASHAARLEMAKKVENFATARYDAGRATAFHKYQAQADRVEAEIGWVKAGGKEKKEK